MRCWRYFAARCLLRDLHIRTMKQSQLDALLDGWMSLPDDDCRRVDADFRKIGDMSGEQGWLAMRGIWVQAELF